MKQLLLLVLFFTLSFLLFAQPELVKSLPAFPSVSIAANGELYFSIEDELWKSDGTDGGTQYVRTFYADIKEIYEAGGILFIYDQSGNMYISDGTDAGTFTFDEGNEIDAVNRTSFIALNNKVYFNKGNKLWFTDGTPVGTDFIPNVSAAGHNVVMGDSLYFINRNATTGLGIYYLKNDMMNPVLVETIADTKIGLMGYSDAKLIYYRYKSPFDNIAMGDSLKIYSLDVLNNSETLLNSSEYYGEGNFNYMNFTQFNNKVVFFLEPDAGVISSWSTDGTIAGTQVLGPNVESFHLRIEGYTKGSTKMAIRFAEEDYVMVWVVDQTANSAYKYVILKKERNSRPFAASGDYFFYSDNETSDQDINDYELYQSKFTTATTNLVRTLANKPDDYYFGTDNLTNVNGTIYFTTGNGMFEEEDLDTDPNREPRLWKYVPPFLDEIVTATTAIMGTKLVAYPNPAQSYLYLENAEGKSVSMYNVNGEKVYSQEKYSQFIDVQGLEHGVYFVRVQDVEQIAKVIVCK
jgi:hypothetical protein